MLDRVLRVIALAAGAIAMAALAALAAVTVVDVSGRYLFNSPLFGAVEISEFLLVLLAFAGFAYAELRKAHITVDFFLISVPRRVRMALETTAALLGVAFWLLVAWRTALHAGRVRAVNDVSFNLAIPTYPFYWIVVIGSILFAVMLLARAIRVMRTGTA